MKILVLGDPHFEVGNLPIMEKVCKEIHSIIDDRKPDLVVSLGDSLHTHERIHLRAQYFAKKFYLEVAAKVPIVVLIGNHDRENNQDFCTNIHPFYGLKNVTVVSTPLWDRERNLIFVPYVPPGRYHEALQLIDYTPGEGPQPKLIFSHQEFKGSVMGIKMSVKGDHWSKDYPLNISGHIHEQQTLPGVFYVGTFIQQTYAESPDKGIYLFEAETATHEKIPITTAPRRIVVHMYPPDLEHIDEKVPEGYLVKVVLHLDATESKDIETNPLFKKLKEKANKVVKKIESNKASIAENMVREMKLAPAIHSTLHVEDIVRAMLKDDPISLSMFDMQIVG